MKLKKRLVLILIIALLILTSCNKTKQEPEPVIETNTPDTSYPAPINTDSPTGGYPIEKTQPTVENFDPSPIPADTPTIEYDEFMELITYFSLDQPARLSWCADQTCIAIIGYENLKVLSYPDLEELFSFVIGENESLLDVSPDGSTYAITTNNEDLILRNWEIMTEKVIPTGTFFMSADFSPDGTKIMVTNMDEWGAPIFDIESGTQTVKLTGFETAAPVYDVRYCQSNDYAVWIARGTIQTSDIATNKLFPAIFHEDFILGFDLNAAGTYLVTSAAEMVNDEYLPTVFIYDFKSGELFQKFTTAQPVYDMEFSPDNLELALSLGNSISLYDIKTKELLTQFVSETEAISQVLFSPDGTILMSSDDGLTVKFFKFK